MPVKKTKVKGGKVRVSTPGGIKAKATTPAKAAAQTRLLQGIEHNPAFAAKVKARAKKKHGK